MQPIQCMQVTFGTPEYDDTVRLRDQVLRIPLGLTFTTEQLSAEYMDIHLAAYDPHWRLVGCLILTEKDPSTVKMRQVVVEPTLQRSGVGRVLVAYSETIARQRGYQYMVLNARDTAIPFYERLGYLTEGQPFEEVGIPHHSMTKQLV
jgi:predicted GNAT family N-acyltransferase